MSCAFSCPPEDCLHPSSGCGEIRSVSLRDFAERALMIAERHLTGAAVPEATLGELLALIDTHPAVLAIVAARLCRGRGGMSLPGRGGMSLPAKVKIGCYDFAIEAWDTRDARGSGRLGEFCPVQLLIRVDAGTLPRQQAQTLIHEIMHAVWWCYELSDEDKQERTVSVMSQGWAAVWRDNPEVFAWIDERMA